MEIIITDYKKRLAAMETSKEDIFGTELLTCIAGIEKSLLGSRAEIQSIRFSLESRDSSNKLKNQEYYRNVVIPEVLNLVEKAQEENPYNI
jgi:hypothetical protein